MIQHFAKYAKGYSTGIAVGVVGPFAQDIVVMIVWLLTFGHVVMPDNVQAALARILTAVIGGGIAALVPNRNSEVVGGI